MVLFACGINYCLYNVKEVVIIGIKSKLARRKQRNTGGLFVFCMKLSANWNRRRFVQLKCLILRLKTVFQRGLNDKMV